MGGVIASDTGDDGGSVADGFHDSTQNGDVFFVCFRRRFTRGAVNHQSIVSQIID